MRKSKKVEIRGVGEVLLERSHRAKHINLTIKTLNAIRVAVPVGVTFADAELFARSKREWMQKHLKRIELMVRQIERVARETPIDRKTAREILVSRLDELSEKHNLPYNKAFVKNQKTRWGSCSMQNNINLNINLVRVPPELMDYAIIHELVHTKVKNHSQRFWDQLERYLPNAGALDQELDQYWFLLSD